LQIFLSVYELTLIPLTVFFQSRSFHFSWSSSYYFFGVLSSTLSSWPRSSRSFSIPCISHLSEFHIELIFVRSIRSVFRFISFHVDFQLFSQCQSDCLLPIVLHSPLFQRPIDSIYMGLLWVLYSVPLVCLSILKSIAHWLL
jgi:hypothetical protein